MLESRRFERVKLPRPIEARIGTVVVSLIDVSLAGLQVHHQDPLPPRDQRCVIRFEWNGAMLHAKTAVADHRWARVGSSNLNVSSWLANWELE